MQIFLLTTVAANSGELQYITAEYVNPITTPYEQYNDINPSWSLNGNFISYERFNSVTHEIVIDELRSKKIKFVSGNMPDDNELALLLPVDDQTHYFAFDISWSPDNERYAFVSNGASNNFDLYLGDINSNQITRLTDHQAIDNQVHWSPTDNNLAFVSSRDGQASLYLYDINNKKTSKLITFSKDVINPVWSSDGKKIAFMGGEGNSFQIYVIDDIKNPQNTIRTVTDLPYNNNIRPSWSPDNSKLSFFTLDTRENAPQQWNIVVIDSHVNSPLSDDNLQHHTVSYHVIQNSLNGPSWLPDNQHIAFVQYVDDHYNPIHLVNIQNKKKALVITNTKMNRDVSCSSKGVLTFQSQDEQWSRIFIAKLPGFKG